EAAPRQRGHVRQVVTRRAGLDRAVLDLQHFRRMLQPRQLVLVEALVVERPTSLTRPALNVAWGAAVPLATNPTVVSTTATRTASANGSSRCLLKRFSLLLETHLMNQRRCYCLPPPPSPKTTVRALWLGHGSAGGAGFRSLRS